VKESLNFHKFFLINRGIIWSVIILIKRRKYENRSRHLRQSIKQTAEFDKKAQITLVGHSLFDMWSDMEQGTPNIAGKTVANLGLSGTSTRQYLDVIVKGNLIKQLGEDVLSF